MGKSKGSKKGKDKGTKKPANQDPKNLEELGIFEEIYTLDKEKIRTTDLEKNNIVLQNIAEQLRTRLDQHLQMQRTQVQKKNEEIAQKDKEIQELTEGNIKLVEDTENDQNDNQEELHDKKTGHLRKVIGLEDSRNDLLAKRDTLLDFKQKKAALGQRLEEYRVALANEQHEHKINAEKLDKRNILEKDRLKNEMLRKIKETKLSLLAMTEDQLHTTTKRTIMENELMTTELQYQSKESDRIMRINKELNEENEELKRVLAVQEKQQQVLATRTRFYQKLVKKLTSQVDVSTHEHELVLYNENEHQNRKTKAITMQLEENEKMIHSLENTISNLEGMARAAKLESEQTQAQVEATKMASKTMIVLQESASAMLLKSLDFILHQKEAQHSDKAPHLDTMEGDRNMFKMPKRLAALTPDEKETLVRMLLHKLNTASRNVFAQ